MYKLVISDDEGKTTVVPLVREQVTIGRQQGNTIRLTERNVSRRHARITQRSGSAVVEDLGSYNGVRVNGEKIEGHRQLRPGDEVKIGDYRLKLKEQAPAEEEPQGPRDEDLAKTLSTGMQKPARLVMLTAPSPAAEYALSSGEVKAGRAEDLGIWVNHRSVSREHAAFVSDGEGIRVRDLGSANGTRVNDQDISETTLRAGDQVELGQVRFRFVGPDDAYTFEGEHPMPTPPRSASRWRQPQLRISVVAAGGVALLSIVVGTVIAMSSGEGGAPTAQRSSAHANPTSGTASAPPQPSDRAPEEGGTGQQAARDCQQALEAGNYEKALSRANTALEDDPQNTAAQQCHDEAQTRRKHAEIFARGKTAFEEGDIDSAYFAFEKLPKDGDHRQREVVEEVMQTFAQRHVDKAKSTMDANPDEAARHADMVLTMQEPPEELASTAEELREQARQQAAGAGEGETEKAGDRALARAGGSRSDARQARRERRQRRRQRARQRERRARAAQHRGGGGSGSASPMDQARECMKRGDNQCVIRALAGKARNARQHALLIETYKQVGAVSKAKQEMRRFMQLYPTDSRASRYRRWLQNN